MFIEPMQGIEAWSGLGQLGAAQDKDKTAGGMFGELFAKSMQNVREAEAQVAADSLALATGDVDDLHTLGINQSKAELSISLLVQMRNGFLDAYNELMRISL